MTSDLDFFKCPHCSCKDFYRQKEFNKAIGCLFITVGAVLVPVTYGMSLGVVAVIDWFLYNRTPDEAVCYQCRKVFKEVSIPEKIKVFDHHLAELYEEPE